MADRQKLNFCTQVPYDRAFVVAKLVETGIVSPGEGFDLLFGPAPKSNEE